jgi:translocation and assembly module TamA
MAQHHFLARALRHSRASMAVLCLLACSVARANIDIEVRGVDEELRSNVLAYLSFERYKRSDDLSRDTLERLHERVEREVQSALRPFGYYEPQVQSSLTEQTHGDWRVTIDITPGRPVLMESVDVVVTGPGATDPLFMRITGNLPMHEGDRLNHAAYDNLKGELQRTAATYGYLDARLTRSELNVDPQNHTARAALELQSGERYRFGTTSIEQTAVDDALVRRYIRYQKGDPFDLTQILRTQFALDDAQYFTDLEVLPGDPDREAHVVPVSIRAQPSRRNRYSFAAGYATDTGVRGTLGWEDRRINSRGHRFTVLLQAAQVTKYSLQTSYIIPIGDPAIEKLSLDGAVEQRQLADNTTRTLSLGPSVTKVDGAFQHVWFIHAMRSTSETSYNGFIPPTQQGVPPTPLPTQITSQTDRLLVPGIDIASVPKGYLGEPLFERGFFVEVRGSHSAIGSDSNFIQAHLQLERVFGFAPQWHLLLRDEVGATLVSQFSQLPTVMRFFAGGDNSVRGFAFNSLSPVGSVCGKDANGNIVIDPTDPLHQRCVPQYAKVGGKDMITGTVEVIRDLPNNFGVAAFFDYGNAFDSFSTPQLDYAAGVGFRVRLPVVTLGVDVAQPLSRSGSPRLHINFSPKL